jgi:HK97 gp10 family phage protein
MMANRTGMQTEVHVEGLSVLLARMRALPEKLQRGPIKRALHSGARVIRDAAKRTNAWRDESGFLRENIVQFALKKSQTQYDATVAIGVRRRRVKRPSKRLRAAAARKAQRARRTISAPFYWVLLEFGTSKMQAHPFMRPAFEANKYEANLRIVGKLREEIEKAEAGSG